MTHRGYQYGHETHDANDAHNALDQMLVEANESISSPSRLEKNVSRAIGRSIAIRRVGAVSSVAMIVLIASVIVQTLPGPASQVQPGGPRAGMDDMVTPSPEGIVQSVPVAHRTAIVYGEPGSKFFARAIPTSKPNVTIVRIYRDLTPAREVVPAPDEAGEGSRDENNENTENRPDKSPDQIDLPESAGPGGEFNETIIRSEA